MKKFITMAAVAAFVVLGTTNSAVADTSVQAQIDALLTQLAALQAGTTTTMTGSAFVFSGTMRPGMSGPGISTLQASLNSVQTMQVAVDGKFGPATTAAVKQFQASQGLSVDGIVGPATGAALTAATSTVITIPTGNLPAGCTSTAGYSSTTGVKCDSGTTLPAGCTSTAGYSSTTGVKCDSQVDNGEFPSTGGTEASLEKFKMTAEDDAEEGVMKHVATIEFDVEDGDVKIERLDLTFDNSNVSNNADKRPWDVFRTLTLKADGKKIGSADLDRRSDWNRDDNPFVFRMTGLDYIVEKGDQAEIEVYLTANNTVRDYQNADWDIYVAERGIRGVDTAGLTQDIGDKATPIDVVSFSVDKKGGAEELKIKSSSNNPAATSLLVKANEKSEWHEVFVYRIGAEENDFDIEDLTVKLDLTGDNYEDVVNDVKVKVDGKEFKRFDITAGGGASTSATLMFDIDNRATVDADENVDVSVWVEFKKESGNYTLPVTVKASATQVRGEGADYYTANSTVAGKTHSLDLTGAEVNSLTATSSKDTDSKVGTFVFKFTVTATEADVDVDLTNTLYTILEPTGATYTTENATLVNLDGDAVVNGANDFTVTEGDSNTFSFAVTLDPAQAGTYYVRLDEAAGVSQNITAGPEALVA